MRGGDELQPRKGVLEPGDQVRRRRWEEAELARLSAKGKPPVDDSWRSRYSPPVASMTPPSIELPAGWRWSTLGELFEIFTGSTPSRSEPSYWGGAIPWVSSGEVAFPTPLWRRAVLAACAAQRPPADADAAVRAAAKWTQDQLGLEFQRLRSGSAIDTALRAALTELLAAGQVRDHDGKLRGA